jgi:hypothetical protein
VQEAQVTSKNCACAAAKLEITPKKLSIVQKLQGPNVRGVHCDQALQNPNAGNSAAVFIPSQIHHSGPQSSIKKVRKSTTKLNTSYRI